MGSVLLAHYSIFEIQIKSTVACVASVSNRVTTGKLEQEQKKKGGRGRGRGEGEEVPSFPSPSPVLSFFFCSRPNFLDELARKRLLRRLRAQEMCTKREHRVQSSRKKRRGSDGLFIAANGRPEMRLRLAG